MLLRLPIETRHTRTHGGATHRGGIMTVHWQISAKPIYDINSLFTGDHCVNLDLPRAISRCRSSFIGRATTRKLPLWLSDWCHPKTRRRTRTAVWDNGVNMRRCWRMFTRTKYSITKCLLRRSDLTLSSSHNLARGLFPRGDYSKRSITGYS